MKKQLKLVAVIATMLVAGIANAQQKTNDIPTKNKNNQTGKDKTVRVIDNKGTIKYLQVQNGITTLTNENNGKTTTTWQLGGTLATNTTITFGTGTTTPTFTLDGEKFMLENIGEVTTDTTDAAGQAATQTSQQSGTHTGYTFLVRDEFTGQVKKMKASDILKVTSEHHDITVGAAAGSTATTVLQDNTQGVALAFKYDNLFMASYSKVQVFRNGAKLRAGRPTASGIQDTSNADYIIVNNGTETISRVIFFPKTAANDQDFNDWEFQEGDIIEIHAIK